jgi:hypothetical protein
MQAHVLAPPDAHPELQAFQPIKAPNTLLVHRPALATKHHMNALVAEARSCVGDLADPQPQCRLVPRLALTVKRRA